MGMLFAKPQADEQAAIMGPALRTPLSDITHPLLHWDEGNCVSFELNYIDCMEAYGQLQGKKKCAVYFQDFHECAQMRKQFARIKAMKNERDKQWVKGQLGLGPKVPLFGDPPPYDSYAPESMDSPEG